MTKTEFDTGYNTWESFRELCNNELEPQNYTTACTYIYSREELKEAIVGDTQELIRQGIPLGEILSRINNVDPRYDFYHSDYDGYLQYRGLTLANLPQFKEECLADLEAGNYPWDEE